MRQISLVERRRMIGRMTLELSNKNGPLSERENSRLQALRAEQDALETEIEAASRNKFYAAWRNMLRYGLKPNQRQRGVTPEEQRILLEDCERRAQGTGGTGAYPGAAGTTGGFFVPLEFNDRVESALKSIGDLFAVATIQDTETGAPRGYPQDNDTTASGEQIAENVAVTNQDLVTISQTVLGAFLYSSTKVIVSMALAEDAGFDLEGYLAERFGVRLGRTLNPKFTTGAGTTEPFGFITRATVAGTAVGSGSNDGGGSQPNTLGSDDLATLEASVDPAYRRNAVFMVHPNTLAALRKVKDKQGRPLFPDLQGGGEDRLLNYRVAVNPGMDQLQSGASSPTVTRKTIAFGDFSKYTIRRVPPMLIRLEQRYVELGQVAFVLLQRFDGDLIDGGGGAVKILQNVY